MARTLLTALLAIVLVTPMAVGLGETVTDTTEEGSTTVEASSTASSATERAVFVGNNWEGTADILQFDPGEGEFSHVATIDVVPDLMERRLEIATDPVRLAYYVGIRLFVGEGNDQYVDDMYSTKDGELLVVSRPSLADVVGIDIETGEIAWRFEVDGQRSDHMALSPDGERVAVSASTGNVVHILDVRTGEELWRFDSGDSPHENVYSESGDRIFHASIGHVWTPADRPTLHATKGEQYFQVVDTETGEIEHRVDMGEKLAEAGYEDNSSAVRPMTLSPDERYVYFQVSFHHGFFEYDLQTHEVLRAADLPNYVEHLPREAYLLDSAHHGIEMNEAGDKLCVAGTMSDYAAIVSRADFENYTILHKGDDAKPYWSTLSDDGKHCFVSWSGHDSVSAISYEDEEIIDTIDVGDHPQRIRTGNVNSSWVNEQT